MFVFCFHSTITRIEQIIKSLINNENNWLVSFSPIKNFAEMYVILEYSTKKQTKEKKPTSVGFVIRNHTNSVLDEGIKLLAQTALCHVTSKMRSPLTEKH